MDRAHAQRAEAVQSAGFVWLFPLTFASSILVLPATMPGWLQPIATANPLTRVADTVRALTVDGYPCGPSLSEISLCTGVKTNLVWTAVWAIAILAIFLPLTARTWNRLA